MFLVILYLVGSVLGMYGLYKIKHLMFFGGLKYLAIGILMISVAVHFNSSGDADKDAVKSTASTEATNEVHMNLNFDDSSAVPQNIVFCIEEMKKMDRPAQQAQRVSPAAVLKKPTDYMGKIVEFSMNVSETVNAPDNAPAAKAYGGKAFVVVGQTDDGTVVMLTRKGDKDGEHNGISGQFTVVVGMVAGLQNNPENGQKILCIAGLP